MKNFIFSKKYFLTIILSLSFSIFANVTISTNSWWTEDNYLLTNLTIQNGAELYIAGGSTVDVLQTISVVGNSEIICQGKNNATTNASGEWVGVGIIIRATNINVEAGSSINADGTGYRFTHDAQIGNGPGGGGLGSGAYGRGGGYGGAGSNGPAAAVGGNVYGEPFFPDELGSAGGKANIVDGAGGGAIHITVYDTLTLNGEISADGADGNQNYFGGGSGGALWIDTWTFSGNGKITADGGAGGFQAGGGGGGRIAIYYSESSFSGVPNSTVSGGVEGPSGGKPGETGTMAFFDVTSNNIQIFGSDFEFEKGSTSSYENIILETGGKISVGEDALFNVVNNFTIFNDSKLEIAGGSLLKVNQNLTITSNSTIVCFGKDNSTTNVAGEWVGVGVSINATNINVDVSSIINADGTGYRFTHDAQIGNGPGGGGLGSGAYGRGGGYGGAGSNGPAAAVGGNVYGEPFFPDELGSAGGKANIVDGAGGGAIHITVYDTLTLNGEISADGADGNQNYFGGGSGGALWIDTWTFSGNGKITADGGAGSFQSGGGGGGRAAIYYFESDFSGVTNSTVDGGPGGSGAHPGEIGTIIFFGHRERFLVSDNSIYINGNQNHFKLRNEIDAPVGLRVQCLASGPNEANKYAPPSTNNWKFPVTQGEKVFGYFMPENCYEDIVKTTWMGDDDAEAKSSDTNSAGFVSSTIGFSDTTRAGWLRAFSSTIITNSAFYGDSKENDSLLDWPGQMNVAWIPANPIISNINPAFIIPFDNVPFSAFERIEGSVDSSISGGNNQLLSEWILVEYRLEGSPTWLILDEELTADGDFVGTISTTNYPVNAFVRARMKDGFTPRTGLPLSDEKTVANIGGPLIIDMTTSGTILTNAWPVKIFGTSLSANSIVLSNTTDGSTHLCSGTDNWICDLTGNNNTLESYVAVAIAGDERAVSTGSVSIDQDNIPPMVTMISPENNFTSRSTSVTFNFTAVDDRHNVAFTEISTNSGTTWFNFNSGDSIVFADHQLCSWRARATDDVPSGNTSAGNVQFNFLIFEKVSLKVMCVWPQLIGVDQTGVVEFISDFGTEYRIFAVDGITQNIAAGTCKIGWNLVPFFGGNLPVQTFNNPNHIFVEIGTRLFDGGLVYLTENLSTVKKNPTTDLDGDFISVSYKGSGTISSKGRTLFIENGSVNDKIMVKVKPAKGTGDGVCRVCGIITDSGFSSVKIAGDLDRLEAVGEGKTVMLKGGNLGQKSATKRFFAILDGPQEKPKGKIIVKASKNKSTKEAIGGNIYASILCGTLQTEPDTFATLGGLKMVAALGGDIGFQNANKHIIASSVGKLSTKAKKDNGGVINDYSAYFTGEEKAGKGMSAKSIFANNIIDSTGSNIFFVFGFNNVTNPINVTNWLAEPVTHSFGKLTVKGTTLDGTFVINEWLKGDKSKSVKSKATDNATWIVNGVKE